MSIKEVLLYIHQLPQNLIGKALTGNKQRRYINLVDDNGKEEKVMYVFSPNCCGCGGSFGKYIILDTNTYYPMSLNKDGKEMLYFINTIRHEHGHQKQSIYFGWLYLIVIGIPSVINNLISRWKIKHNKSISQEELDSWYYSRYPENWADKLGCVSRMC